MLITLNIWVACVTDGNFPLSSLNNRLLAPCATQVIFESTNSGGENGSFFNPKRPHGALLLISGLTSLLTLPSLCLHHFFPFVEFVDIEQRDFFARIGSHVEAWFGCFFPRSCWSSLYLSAGEAQAWRPGAQYLSLFPYTHLLSFFHHPPVP